MTINESFPIQATAMTLPSFFFEKRLWKKGYKVVAGADEVGRGSFAGPVVAGCVVFSNIRNTIYQIPVRIDDSKKLTSRQRNAAARWIRKHALAWGVGVASVSQVNRLGIKKASEIAFRKAIQKSRSKYKIDYLLIDAFFVPYVRGLPVGRKNPALPAGRQKAIIHGDAKSISIAAASIIAKVYRDNLMTSLGKVPEHKHYGWGRNKGYGTPEHQNALVKFGMTRHHRNVFVDSFLRSRLP